MKVYEKKLAETHPQTRSDEGVEDGISALATNPKANGSQLQMPQYGNQKSMVDAMVKQSLRKWDQLDVNLSLIHI